MEVWCRQCNAKNEFPRNWMDASDACRYCKSQGLWRTCDEPLKEYELTHNDRRFLKALRITQT